MKEKNLNKKKAKVLTVVAVVLLLAIVIGAAYAYFQAQVGNGTSADVNVITGTTDLLTFSINDLDASTGNDKVTDNDSSEEIIINANETNFGKNEDGSIDNSIADGVKAAATLMANNTTKKANDSYNVFLVIDLNQLKHTTPENKPELLLTVTNPNQETMRQIVSNLEYHQKDISNEKDVDGFDITGKREVIEIAKDYQIKVDGSTDESNLTTTQEWKIKVTLVNLTTNQNENTGKQVTGKVIITKEDNIKLSNINTLSINRTINNITAEVKADNEEIAEYYFKIDGEMPEAAALSLENDEEWAKEEQATHNFGTLKENTEYMISAYGIDNNGFKTNIYETKVSTGEEALPTINSVTVSDVTYDSIKINVNGSDGITSYEYSINGGESLINQNAEYTFSDLKTGVNYEIKVRGKTEEEVYSSTYVINTKIPIIGEICKGQEMSKCIKENYKLDSNINYHNVEAAEADGIENYDKVAGDDSYRYSGADGEVKNYVCLDGTTTGTTCADADLYRIIGIFKNEQEQYEMKLIKATPATTTELGDSTAKADGENSELPSAYASGRGYYWNSSLGTDSSANNVNMWKESNLNKVNLNSFYYKYMTETKGLTNKIADHTWVVGNNWSGGNAKEVYDNEVGTKKLTSSSKNCYNQGNIIEKRECNLDNDIIYPAKIGLMYISDYMYGTSATNWTTIATNYKNDEVKNNNWLYIGASEWTISRLSEYDDITRIVNYTGTAYSNGSVYSYNVVRPTFYLTSDTKLASGKGTKEEPFRFELN